MFQSQCTLCASCVAGCRPSSLLLFVCCRQKGGVLLHAETAQDDGREAQEGLTARMHAVRSSTSRHVVQEWRED